MKKSVYFLFFAFLFTFFSLRLSAASRDLVVMIDTGMSMRENKAGNGEVCVYKEVAARVKEFFREHSDKNTNIKVIAVVKHKDQQRLDMSRVLLNVIGGQRPDFTNLTHITPCPDEWSDNIFRRDTDPNPTDLGLFYNDVFKSAKNKIYVVITNSKINRDRFFNSNKSQRVGKLDIEKVIFPNNVKAFLVTLPQVNSCGEQGFKDNECPKYVIRGLSTAWKETSFEPPRGDVFIDFQSSSVTKSVKVGDKTQSVVIYAPVDVKLRATNLSNVEEISTSGIATAFKAGKVTVENGKRSADKNLGTIKDPGDYRLNVSIYGCNGEEIKQQILFTVAKPIILGDIGNKSKVDLGKTITLWAKAPDFKVQFPIISGAKDVVWKREGTKFDPVQENVFTAEAEVVAEINGVDGEKYEQKFSVRIEDIKFWAKANDTLLGTGNDVSISVSKSSKVIFTSASSQGVKWYRGKDIFVPSKAGDRFEESTNISCKFEHKRKVTELFITILVESKTDGNAKPVKNKFEPPKPKFGLKKVSVGNVELSAEAEKYTVSDTTPVDVDFEFTGKLFTVTAEREDGEFVDTSVKQKQKWSYQFDGTPVKFTFTGSGKVTVSCALEPKQEGGDIVPIDNAGGDEFPVVWVIIIIIAVAAAVGFFVFKLLGGKDIIVKFNDKECRKFNLGKHKIDREVFSECSQSFTIELSMKKNDGDKDYYVKFILEHDWQLQSGYELLDLNSGSSAELRLGKYKVIPAEGEEMELDFLTKEDL